MPRIVGLLFSGAAVRAAGAGAALWIAHLAYATLSASMAQVNQALAVIQ